MARVAVAYLLPREQLEEDFRTDGLVLGQTVVERDPARRTGLARALGPIAQEEADTLLAARLGAVADSFGELMRLLDWLGEHGASLIALDVGLDTAARSGQHTLAVLREVHGWAREPGRPRRPPGRPGLNELAPAVARRIATLREQGLSLHAIAQALNTDGVPTPRGGATWRASSVQSVLGYRRPHPPIPGPGKGPRHRHRGPPRPRPKP